MENIYRVFLQIILHVAYYCYFPTSSIINKPTIVWQILMIQARMRFACFNFDDLFVCVYELYYYKNILRFTGWFSGPFFYLSLRFSTLTTIQISICCCNKL